MPPIGALIAIRSALVSACRMRVLGAIAPDAENPQIRRRQPSA